MAAGFILLDEVVRRVTASESEMKVPMKAKKNYHDMVYICSKYY